MYDLVIRGGRIVDGTGNPWFRGDVAIQDGRIAAIRREGFAPESGAQVIDAGGLVVAPGFIDIHTHSDTALLADPGAAAKLRQGVTTEVLGNCGMSASPLTDLHLNDLRDYALPIMGYPEVDWTWRSLDEYWAAVRRAGPAVNVATYIGLGTIRCAVMGYREGAPTDGELAAMARLVDGAMQDGAVGVTTGLVYAPGTFSPPEEIWALARVAARHGGVYSSHIRDQGDGFLESIAETIEVGRRAGIPVIVAHHKVVGQRNWGQVQQSLAMLDAARQQGVDAGSDSYPYLAGSTTMTALLPPWALEGGGEAMLRRLGDPAARGRIQADWDRSIPGWDNRVGSLGWASILINFVGSAANQDLIGLSVAAAAERRGRGHEPGEFLLDLLHAERGQVGNIQIACREADLHLVMAHPATSFGSDGLHVGKRPHPRLYGTFPRILGEYVRRQRVLPLEEAVRKMTSLTARRLGLAGVGLIEAGYRADLTLFDPESVIDRATYAEPTLAPAGIVHVLVGGRLAVANGKVTGERAGVPLLRG
ncbi:MAG TPA: D-aminoacylase [Symbiobacteriaceae bacterium]|jgi:dihydroorotase/N-acyl-D-amino-acid deacylase